MDNQRSMIELPTEIIEKIMFYSDSSTLLAVARTCSSWNKISQRFLKDNSWWKMCCQLELNVNEILTVLQSTMINSSSVYNHDIDWCFVRKCVRRWNNIDYWKFITEVHHASHVDNQLICARILGEKNVIQVLGAKNYFECTNSSLMEICTVSTVFVFNDLIIDLNGKLINTVLNICKEIHPCEPCEIHRNCAVINYIEEKIIYYSKNTLYCMNLKYIQEEMKIPHSRVLRSKAIECLAKNYAPGLILAISYWNSRILLLNEFGILFTLRNNTLEKIYTYNFSEYHINCAFLYSDIIFIITVNGSVIVCQSFHIKEFKNAGENSFYHPSTIYLHGNLLFVGSNNGKVFIYYQKNIMDINMKFCNHEVVCDPYPISHIEMKEKDDFLNILITSRASVYELKIKDERSILIY